MYQVEPLNLTFEHEGAAGSSTALLRTRHVHNVDSRYLSVHPQHVVR